MIWLFALFSEEELEVVGGFGGGSLRVEGEGSGETGVYAGFFGSIAEDEGTVEVFSVSSERQRDGL